MSYVITFDIWKVCTMSYYFNVKFVLFCRVFVEWGRMYVLHSDMSVRKRVKIMITTGLESGWASWIKTLFGLKFLLSFLTHQGPAE